MTREGDIIVDGPWAGFEVIHVYTRAQAIADVLVDVSETAREAGFRVPVAVTSAVWDLIRPTSGEEEACQDEQGRLWDVLCLAFNAIRRSSTSGNELLFFCYFILIGRPGVSGLRRLTLKLHSGPGDEGEHVITLMLPEED